jgi:hypothetical protein
MTYNKSTAAHLERILSNHSHDTIFNIIEDGLVKGRVTERITDELNAALNEKIPPRVIPMLFNMWFPGLYDMRIAERREWIYTHWSFYGLEANSWSKLYDPNHPVYKHFTRKNNMNYNGQKSMAKKRGVEFKLDFVSWIVWWIQTGHFDERGVLNHNYQMCRIGDTGAYEWDNIYCATGEQNKDDRVIDAKGWTQISKNSYKARIGSATIGCYSTPEEAHEAYLDAKKKKAE